MSESEIEARLTETLRAVADQTEAESKLGFLPGADTEPNPTPGLRSRGLWLAAAAAVAVVAGGGTYLALAAGDGDGPDIGTVEPAEEPEIDLDRVDDDGNPVDDAQADSDTGGGGAESSERSLITPTPPVAENDDILFLLPADPLTDAVELAVGADVVDESSLPLALIGRPVDGGIEWPFIVYQATPSDPFGIDSTTSEVIAGHEVFDSFDEGVARELADGTWLIYQTEFGDPFLETLVAGTEVIDGTLTFDGGDSDLEEIRVFEPGTEAKMTLFHEPPSMADPGPVPDGEAPGFRLFTTRSDDPLDGALWATALAATELRETAVGDRPGYVFSVDFDGGSVAIVGWSPFDGYAASMIVWGLSEADAIDFAADMIPVDEETWQAQLEG